jgi:hypothetical protein
MRIYRLLRPSVAVLLMSIVLRPGAGASTHGADALHAQIAAAEDVPVDAAMRCRFPHEYHAPTKQTKSSILEIKSDSVTECNKLWITVEDDSYLHDPVSRQNTYDTAKLFIEHCHNDPRAHFVFLDITSSVGGGDATVRATTLAWLESVLYLNTQDPEYFCQCVQAIAGELPLPNDTSPGYLSRETNIGLSVYQWLIQNTACDTPGIRQVYDGARGQQYSQWQNNPHAYTLDTTLPPLSTWGLDTLFAKHFLYLQTKSGPSIITSLTAYPNPTPSGVTLQWGMAQDAYVRVELFDLLGNAISLPQAGEEYATKGNHSIPIDVQSLASGTYYARVTTAYGEVETVKILKE